MTSFKSKNTNRSFYLYFIDLKMLSGEKNKEPSKQNDEEREIEKILQNDTITLKNDNVFSISIENEIDENLEEFDDLPEPKFTEGNVKNHLAQWGFGCYLLLLASPLVLLILGKITTSELIDITKNYAALLGGLIGAIVAYYFKK